MKKTIASGKFKKDFKKYKHKTVKVSKLYAVLDLLRHEIPLPSKYKPHLLKGTYKGCMECPVPSSAH